MITGHGARSITGVETGLNINTVTEKQLEAIPGIGKKAAMESHFSRAKLMRKQENPSLEAIFDAAKVNLDSTMLSVLSDK